MNKIACCIILSFFIASSGCNKDEDPKPDSDYSGTLIMEYSRAFPEFAASVTVEVNIYKTGIVAFSDPDQANYVALDSLSFGDRMVKLNETGTITLSELEGKWTVRNNGSYLSVNAHTVIEGMRSVWEWDDIAGWIAESVLPFSTEDPVANPMDFSITEALETNGSFLGAYETSEYGSLVYKWTLKVNTD